MKDCSLERTPPPNKQCPARAKKRRQDALAFGAYVPMDQVIEVLENTMVGRARRKQLGAGFLKDWVKEHCEVKLRYVPKVRLLAKGWFSFFSKGKRRC